tara:strand:- start:29248 stop:29463 length:216 start_codon:yes stop_codon:yes gene_type:complete
MSISSESLMAYACTYNNFDGGEVEKIYCKNGYVDLIAQLNERERRDKITAEKEKRRECWKGSGKRKKNKHL